MFALQLPVRTFVRVSGILTKTAGKGQVLPGGLALLASAPASGS